MAFELPALPYSYNALEPYIDETTMRIHHDKHHGGYVEKLNTAIEGNSELSGLAIGDLVTQANDLEGELHIAVKNNGGGHLNHSMFWEMMGPNQTPLRAGRLQEAIESSFGNFDSFTEKFSDAALKHFGSGWIWLVSDNGALTILGTPNQDSPLMVSKKPILGIDVWEHAYYLKYQNKRADYIKAWWNVVNWQRVEENFNKK